MGILNKGMINNATLISDVKDTTKNYIINLGSSDKLVVNKPPIIDLILAVPRPDTLVRLLSIVTSLGVRNLILIGAKKVEKAYFGT